MITSRDDIEPGYGTKMQFQLDFSRYYACIISVGYLKIAEDNGPSPIDEKQTIKTYDMPLSLGLRAKFSPNRIRPFMGAALTFHTLKTKVRNYHGYVDTYDLNYNGLGMETGIEITTSRRSFAFAVMAISDIANQMYISMGLGMSIYLIK